MVIPALVYIFIAQQDPTLADGWAIPMATDIAFALGIMALLSKQVPLPLKIFLLALAIIDDLGAIVVIALFFSHGLSVQALAFAAIAIAVLIALNHFKVTALCAYIVVGTILWASVLKSGVHATLAVSYTHLDVYKRQSQSSINCSAGRSAKERSNFATITTSTPA